MNFIMSKSVFVFVQIFGNQCNQQENHGNQRALKSGSHNKQPAGPQNSHVALEFVSYGRSRW